MTMNIKRAEYIGTYVTLSQLPQGSWPEVALVGRSNVGKSSMINRLVNRKNLAKSSSTPGKTRTINYYGINEQWYLVDLPGYGFARVAKSEKEKWSRMIETYLKNRTQLRGVIQLVDIRHAPNQNDILMKNWLQNSGIPLLVVATKADKVSRGTRPKNLSIIRKTMELDEAPLFFSAETGEGAAELLETIAELID
jgi:ribosome biogenesis GTP-binding protein YsxC/EngB